MKYIYMTDGDNIIIKGRRMKYIYFLTIELSTLIQCSPTRYRFTGSPTRYVKITVIVTVGSETEVDEPPGIGRAMVFG